MELACSASLALAGPKEPTQRHRKGIPQGADWRIRRGTHRIYPERSDPVHVAHETPLVSIGYPVNIRFNPATQIGSLKWVRIHLPQNGIPLVFTHLVANKKTATACSWLRLATKAVEAGLPSAYHRLCGCKPTSWSVWPTRPSSPAWAARKFRV